jgi:hypothetical protein
VGFVVDEVALEQVFSKYFGFSELRCGFGSVIGFTGYLQGVTTINYYTIAALHNVQSLHTKIFSLSALFFTGL